MDRAYWTKALREAERELEAATTRTAVNAAAKKLQRAKAELKQLKETPTERASSCRRGSGGTQSSLMYLHGPSGGPGFTCRSHA
jgi:hypothetical protein